MGGAFDFFTATLFSISVDRLFCSFIIMQQLIIIRSMNCGISPYLLCLILDRVSFCSVLFFFFVMRIKLNSFYFFFPVIISFFIFCILAFYSNFIVSIISMLQVTKVFVFQMYPFISVTCLIFSIIFLFYFSFFDRLLLAVI